MLQELGENFSPSLGLCAAVFQNSFRACYYIEEVFLTFGAGLRDFLRLKLKSEHNCFEKLDFFFLSSSE